MTDVPWANTTIDLWIEKLVSECLPQEMLPGIIPSVKQHLFSPNTNDEIQYPLYELLGEKSFQVIQTLLDYRNQIKQYKDKTKQNNSTNNSQYDPTSSTNYYYGPKISAPMMKRSNFCKTETINASRYDVEAPTCPTPKVKHVPITQLPSWAQQCFPGCSTFNNIQSLVFDQAFNKKDNMLVCAPTGAGKTNVALLTILQELKQHIIAKQGLPSVVNQNDNFLIVYITPMKALATEIKEKFTNSLRHLKVNVKEYTGDTRVPASELERSHILVATPEKWDIATRRGGEDAPSARLKLLIIDEIHLLQDDRGPVLEALVARTLRQVEQTQSMIRIVGLSATLPNCQDVGRFLRCSDDGLFIFGPEYRPVPLAMTLIGAKNVEQTPPAYKTVYDEAYQPNRDKDVIQIDVIAVELIKNIIAEKHQVLIFVHTRGETARFARFLAKFINLPPSDQLQQLLSKKSLQPQLRECLQSGVGIHHAGLPRNDRLFVENGFRQNAFQVLICTATLAWGVNLPAHTVIIKDTKVYNQEHGGFEDIGILDVHQMFGRAGRPQFDTSGHAILITTTKTLPKYTTTLVNAEPIKSQFMNKVEDFLNAEISLGTVTSRRDAFQWIKYTFLYQVSPNDELIMQKLDFAALELSQNFMIRTSLANDSLQSTYLGQVASMHYIPFKAVRHFNDNLNGDMPESQLLDCIFTSGMFQSLLVRNSEIKELESFKTVIPLLTPCDEIPGKVNVLFQSHVSRHAFRTASLALDQGWMADNMERVFDAIFELAIEQGWCFIARFALNFCKMTDHQVWWTSEKHEHPLRQIFKQPKYNSMFQKLDRLGLTVDDLKSIELHKLSKTLKNETQAIELINAAKRFPCVNIGATYKPMSNTIIALDINLLFPFDWENSIVRETEMFWIFVEEVDGSAIHYSQEITIDKRIAKTGLHTQVLVPVSTMYLISISSVRFLGVGDEQEITIKEAEHASFQPHVTELLPLKNKLNVKTLFSNNPAASQIFNSIETFNSLQTQIFYQTFHTNDSILLCAPTSAGKTVIAELALTKMLNEENMAKALYLAPLKSIIHERLKDWTKKFDNQIAQLANDNSTDIEKIKKARIIISTPERWDTLSRSNKVTPLLKTISLLVLDELHLLGTDRGHIIEAVTVRMKYITPNIRIIGLSNTVSNPLDIAQFIDVSYRSVFNFNIKTRMVPLLKSVRGFPGRHFSSRMAAMNKPLSDDILELSQEKPTLVFVSSRKQTRLTASDLISYASTSGKTLFYVTPRSLAAAKKVQDKELSRCLTHGVGLHHAALLPNDQEIVETLFAEGHLKLLIATSNFAWNVKLSGYLVIIKGTEYYNPRTGQFVPYSVTEMQQMMNHAGRPNIDSKGIVRIFCEETRKEFLEDFISCPFPIESSMLPSLYDHINAEIANQRITSHSTLKKWLEHTYFSIRLNLNPLYYKNNTLAQLAEDAFKELSYSNCIKVNNDSYLPTPAGRIASIFYVSYKTVRLFLDKMKDANTVVDILALICRAFEFKEIVLVRRTEDDFLNQMTPKYKYKGRIEAYHLKTYYLVQYYLSHRKMPLGDFDADVSQILDIMPRLIGCYTELCAVQNNLKGVLNSIIVNQMIIQGIWYDETPLKSLMKEQLMKELRTKHGINTLPQLIFALKDETVNKNLQKNALQPICNPILVYQPLNRRLNEGRKQFAVDLTKVNGIIGSDVISPHFNHRDKQFLYVIIGDPEKNLVISHKRIKLDQENISILLKAIPNSTITDSMWVYFMSDSYIGIDQMYSISGTAVMQQLYLRPKKVIAVEKKKRKMTFTPSSNSSQISTEKVAEKKNHNRNEKKKQNPKKQDRFNYVPSYNNTEDDIQPSTANQPSQTTQSSAPLTPVEFKPSHTNDSNQNANRPNNNRNTNKQNKRGSNSNINNISSQANQNSSKSNSSSISVQNSSRPNRNDNHSDNHEQGSNGNKFNTQSHQSDNSILQPSSNTLSPNSTSHIISKDAEPGALKTASSPIPIKSESSFTSTIKIEKPIKGSSKSLFDSDGTKSKPKEETSKKTNNLQQEIQPQSTENQQQESNNLPNSNHQVQLNSPISTRQPNNQLMNSPQLENNHQQQSRNNQQKNNQQPRSNPRNRSGKHKNDRFNYRPPQ